MLDPCCDPLRCTLRAELLSKEIQSSQKGTIAHGGVAEAFPALKLVQKWVFEAWQSFKERASPGSVAEAAN